MSREFDALIVGGGPAGIITGTTIRQNYEDVTIGLIRPEEYVVVPCGIPYIFGTLDSVEKNKISDKGLEKNDIELIKELVTKINPKKQTVTLQSNEEIKYKKLVLATGSKPAVPPIPGVEKENVFPVAKNHQKLQKMLEVAQKAEDIVIVGGGFIGVEFADEFRKKGKNVTIVEMLPKILQVSFDEEYCDFAQKKLEETGIKVYTNQKVTQIQGEGKVSSIKLDSGEELKADMVIMATGAKPSIDLAKEAGLTIGPSGAIAVDEYLKTSEPNISAVGDCAEKRDFFTRQPSFVMLASIATAEARVAGANLFKLKVVREIKGTLGIYATHFQGITLGAAGITEAKAKEMNIDYVIGTSETWDKHPGNLPNASKLTTKIIATKQNGQLIGAQIAGGVTAGEIINILGFAIQTKMSAWEYANLQVGTHPFLTAPPTKQASMSAAENALKKIT